MTEEQIKFLKGLSNGTATAPSSPVQEMAIVNPNDVKACPTPKPTVSNPIDTQKLRQAKSETVSFELTNKDTDNAHYVYVGVGNFNGLVALMGQGTTGDISNAISSKYGLPDATPKYDTGSGIMGPAISDDWTAGALTGPLKLQNFNEMAKGHTVLLENVRIFNASDAQMANNIETVLIDGDGNVRRERASNVMRNKDLNYITLSGCALPASFYEGFIYKLGAGESVTMELDILGVDTIGDYSAGLNV